MAEFSRKLWWKTFWGYVYFFLCESYFKMIVDPSLSGQWEHACPNMYYLEKSLLYFVPLITPVSSEIQGIVWLLDATCSAWGVPIFYLPLESVLTDFLGNPTLTSNYKFRYCAKDTDHICSSRMKETKYDCHSFRRGILRIWEVFSGQNRLEAPPLFNLGRWISTLFIDEPFVYLNRPSNRFLSRYDVGPIGDITSDCVYRQCVGDHHSSILAKIRIWCVWFRRFDLDWI